MTQESVQGYAEPALEVEEREGRPLRFYGGWTVTYDGQERSGRTAATYASELEARHMGLTLGNEILEMIKAQARARD